MAQHNPAALPYLLIVLGGVVIGFVLAGYIIGGHQSETNAKTHAAHSEEAAPDAAKPQP